MKKLFTLFLLCACMAAGAQTQTLGPVYLYRGVATGKAVSHHPDLAACAAASVTAKIRDFSCEVRGKNRPAPVVCPPAPAASSTTTSRACAANEVGGPIVTTTPRTASVGPAPACVVTWTDGAPVVTGTPCTPRPVDPVPTGSVLHFSDCQPGAVSGCVAGNDANPGTQAQPKRTLAGLNLNTLPPGSLLFARGGKWAPMSIGLRNLLVTPTAPLVFDAYTPAWANQSTPLPILTSSAILFNVGGTYGDMSVEGGYTFRNLKFDGVTPNDSSRAFFIHSGTRAVIIEQSEIVNFGIGVEMQNIGGGNQGLTIRSSLIAGNSRMGILGDAHDLLIEGNLFQGNNFSGSGFNHAIYLSSHADARNAILRNNRLINNSTVSGVCQGGNMTVHGLWTGLLIEGNTVSQTASTWGCWGISITDGYTEAEYFRNAVVRANQVINLESAIAIRGAPGILVERNVVRSNQGGGMASGVTVIPPNGPEDDRGANAVVRDNVVCFEQPSGAPVRVTVAGGTETGTIFRSGADATTGACAR